MALSKAQMGKRLHMLDLILEHDDLNGDLQLDVLTVLMSVAGQMELLSRSPLSGAGAAPRDTRSLENETSNQPRSDVCALRDNLRRLKVSWSGMETRGAAGVVAAGHSPVPGAGSRGHGVA